MAPSPVFAVDWVYVTSSDLGSDYYYDKDSIRKMNNGVAVWEMEDAKNNKSKSYRTNKLRILYNCERETFAIMASIKTKADGTVSDMYDFADYELKHRPIAPGTLGQTQFNAICGN